MDTAQVVARFEVERQALALMDHPGIAIGYHILEPGRIAADPAVLRNVAVSLERPLCED